MVQEGQDGLRRSNKVQGTRKLKGFMMIQKFQKVTKGSRGFQKAQNLILMFQKGSRRLKKIQNN